MKILVDIPEDILLLIDKLCAKEERNRSQVIRLALKQYLNPGIEPQKFSPNAVKCEKPFCKSPSLGKFQVSVQDDTEGNITTEEWLCFIHYSKAKREGEAIKLE